MKRKRAVKRRSQLWSSRMLVLAAMVFVAAGFGTLLVSTTVDAELIKTSPSSCEEAKQKALQGEKENDGPATDKFVGEGDGAQTLSNCFGAIMNEKGKQKKQKGEKLDQGDYDCTGRGGTTTVSPGNVTSVTLASKGSPPSKCDTKVTNKGLGDKGKGEPPKAEKGKGEGKGQEKGGEAPKMPEIPKGEPKKQDPSGNPMPQCQTEAEKAKPECRELQGGKSLMDSLRGAGEWASNVASGAKSAFDGLLSAIASPAAAEPASLPPESPASLPSGDSVGLEAPTPSPSQTAVPAASEGQYTPPASTGLEYQESGEVTADEKIAAQAQLGVMERTLQNIMNFLARLWN